MSALPVGNQTQGSTAFALTPFGAPLAQSHSRVHSATPTPPPTCRFSYCVLASLHLLGSTHAVNRESIAGYIIRCQNADGAFGVVPGSESHAGQTFCCVATLSLCGVSIPRQDLLGRTRGTLAILKLFPNHLPANFPVASMR